MTKRGSELVSEVGGGLFAGTWTVCLAYLTWECVMIKFLLWCLLFFFCWPLALMALVLYPLVWLILLPFRILGIAVEGVLELVAGIIMLPDGCCGLSSLAIRLAWFLAANI